MSDTKLLRYLNREPRAGNPHGHIVILSDSKGRYLRNVRHNFREFNIHFEGKSGLRLFQGLYWLKDNISDLINHFGYIQLHVWLGTCDLTLKSKDHQLVLRWVEDDACYRYMLRQIESYCQFLSNYPNVKLIFLQVPPFSIVRWHNKKGLLVTDQTKQDDLTLFRRISYINELIESVNDRHMVSSVRFKLDLVQEKKAKNKDSRKSISYKQYLDGIHPNELLSKVWLKRIWERALLN